MITEEVILKYLSKGMSVFPVMVSWNESQQKYDKRPVGDWKQYMTQLATKDEVMVWSSMFQFNALGMATGKLSGILVVDVDDQSSNRGFDSPVRVKTISGGHHFYYKYQPGVRNKAHINGIPVDIRGEGGYVVIPPSACGDKKYEWESWEFDKLPDFPQIDFEPVYKPTISELPKAASGNRNQTAITVAGHIVANTKQKAFETVAWPSLLNWNQTMCDPPLDERELRTTFESACTMQTRNHPDKNPVNIYFGKNITIKHQKLIEKWGDGIPTGYENLDKYFTFLPEHLYLVASPTHHGKTTVTLNIAARVASFGHRVLYCSLEQGLFVAPRIKTILGSEVPDGFGLLDSSSLIKSSDLVEIVNQMSEKPELIVIDHLHFMEKNMKYGITGGIDEMMIHIQNMAKNLSLPVMVISHLRKLNEDRAPTLDDLRDSSSLGQIPSVVIQLHLKTDEKTGVLGNVGQLIIRKNRITGKMGSMMYTIKPSGEVLLKEFS